MGARLRAYGLLAAVLGIQAFWITACGPSNTPSGTSSSITPTPTIAYSTFKITNSISGLAITTVNLVTYPGGSTLSYSVSVPSGATTVLEVFPQINSGNYFVIDIYDSNGQYDGWGPIALNLGGTYPVTINGTTGTFNSATCNPCGI